MRKSYSSVERTHIKTEAFGADCFLSQTLERERERGPYFYFDGVPFFQNNGDDRSAASIDPVVDRRRVQDAISSTGGSAVYGGPVDDGRLLMRERVMLTLGARCWGHWA